MFRVGIITKQGKTISKNLETKENADAYILEIAEKEDIKMAVILNKETKEREYLNFEKEIKDE